MQTEEGVRGKEWRAQPGCGEADGGRMCVCISDTPQRQVRTDGLGQQHARGVRTRSSAPDVRAAGASKPPADNEARAVF